MSKLAGLTCMVTGGAGGLGLATTQHLIANGSKVILCDLPSTNGAYLAKGIDESRCIFHPTDVTSESDVQSAVAMARKEFGSLKALVNCAGISQTLLVYNSNKKRFAKMEALNEMLDVNSTGTFNAIRLACEAFALNEPDVNGERGVIVNTSSISAYDGQMGQAMYSASKGAVSAMTLPIARDLASMGVRVMTIAPGLFESALINDNPLDKKYLAGLNVFPKRLGFPEEYALLVQTIIENHMLNGEVIRLDAGCRTPS